MKRWTQWIAAWAFLFVATLVLADERRVIHFPDPPGYEILVCDFHMHTVFSDGSVWPTVRVDEAWREGLDAIAITDHIEYQPHRDDVPTNHNRPYELARDLARSKNLLLVRGAEITRETPPGHHNAILVEDIDPLDTPEFFDVFAEAARQNAFVFWNHPGWQGPEKGQWSDSQARLLKRKHLHGIEVCNGAHYYKNGHKEAMNRDLTLMGNSDTHGPSPTNQWTPTDHRTVTLVFARSRSVDALREALFAGRTVVWWQNTLIGRAEQLKPLFDACLSVHPAHRRTDDSVWVEIDNHCELDVELEADGDVRPAHVNLPALSTSLVRFYAPKEMLGKGLPYRAVNFVPAPGESLPVSLSWSGARSRPEARCITPRVPG